MKCHIVVELLSWFLSSYIINYDNPHNHFIIRSISKIINDSRTFQLRTNNCWNIAQVISLFGSWLNNQWHQGQTEQYINQILKTMNACSMYLPFLVSSYKLLLDMFWIDILSSKGYIYSYTISKTLFWSKWYMFVALFYFTYLGLPFVQVKHLM